jgi:hypothetical protein
MSLAKGVLVDKIHERTNFKIIQERKCTEVGDRKYKQYFIELYK